MDAACSRRARPREPTLFGPAAARDTGCSARDGRARPGPLPHGPCPRGRNSGVGEGKGVQGARERRPSRPSPAPAGAHARPGAARPSARDPHPARGAGGGDADVAPPFPLARADDRPAAASPPAPWPAAHHVSGREKEIARRARKDKSRCSCCRDPTERGLSRPLPFSTSRTMRGGAGFRRSPRGPTGNEVRESCAVFGLAG